MYWRENGQTMNRKNAVINDFSETLENQDYENRVNPL